jgi:hypothetical protein
VAATDHNDTLASFSNFGNGSVDIGAPGVSVLSTTPGATYTTFNGTSMATPHVAGVAALAWAVQNDATYQEIRASLLEGADEVPGLGNFVATGGRVNAWQTLQLINPNGATLRFDRDAYQFPGFASISVFDTDPDRDPQARDTVTVSLTSTTEQTPESVVLTETGFSTRVFTGTIQLAAGSSVTDDGRLQLAHGDLITATYVDALPGAGPGVVTDTATADIVAPVIGQVLSAPSARRATVQWTTDESSDSVVRFGTNPNDLDQTVTAEAQTTSHSLVLFGLTSETTYFYEVTSADSAGNTVTESGHTFVTLSAPPILFVDDDEGATLDSFFTAALDSNGYIYSTWDVDLEGRAPDALELSDHSTVIWNTGANYEAPNSGITPSEEIGLRAFLDNGGNLFLVGQDIIFNGVSNSFLHDYLHVSDFIEDVSLVQVLGAENDPIGDGLSLSIAPPAPLEEDFADRILPDEFASGALYAAGSDGTPPDVAVRYPIEGDGPYKSVFFSFPFEAISTTAEDPNNQSSVMQRVMDWFGNDAPGRPGFTLSQISGLQTSERGDSETITVTIKTEPLANVDLTISTIDPTEGLLSTAGGELAEQVTLTFTPENWQEPQEIIVTGVDDDLPDGDRDYVLVTDPALSTDPAYAGIDPVNISVTNLDDRPFMVQGIVEEVGNIVWTEVTLDRPYDSVVVVATPNYGSEGPAGVVRIRNAEGDRFEVRVDSTNGEEITDASVHYLILEEGAYNLAEHGVNLEARKYTSTITDGPDSWVGESQPYSNSYENPVVLGQVMSYNDANWSVFWSGGQSSEDAPGQFLKTGKHAGEDPNRARLDETIGYIVLEAGNGTLGGFNYTAAVGADTVFGVGNGVPSIYPLTGLSSASTAIAIQAGMDGWNGGWAVLYGDEPVSTSSLQLAIDEDQAGDEERDHTTEQVAYIVFERVPNLPPLIDLDVDDSSGAEGTGYDATLLFSHDETLIADGDAELADPTSDHLAWITVTITNVQDGDEEALLANTEATSIVSSYDAETGELLLAGPDSIENFERVIRTVTYQNNANNRDPRLRIVEFRAFDGSLWSEPAIATVTFAEPNQPPLAHAGGPHTLQRNSTLLLNGSLSIDPDAGPFPLTYEWDVNFTGEFEADTFGRVTTFGWGQLVQEGIEQGGTYTVALRVFDGEHDSIATTQLTVEPNRPPIVNTGGPYAIQPGWTLFLNSLGSYDPEGGASVLKVEWDVDFDGEFKADATGATVPLSWTKLKQMGIKPGENFTVAVRASDGMDTVTATTQVTVSNNQPPVPITGGPYVTQPGWTVFLRSSGSFDPDFGPSPLSYEWDLNYDGEFEVDLTGSIVTVPWNVLQQHDIEPGKTYPIALRVDDGASTGFARTSITVTGTAATGFALNAASDSLLPNLTAGNSSALALHAGAFRLFAAGFAASSPTPTSEASNSVGSEPAPVAGFEDDYRGIPIAVEEAIDQVVESKHNAEDWLDELYEDWSWVM